MQALVVKREEDSLLTYIAIACALLFASAVTFIVIAQTVAPFFGMQAGSPSDAALGTMVAAVVTLTTAAGVKALKRLRGDNDEPPDQGESA